MWRILRLIGGAIGTLLFKPSYRPPAATHYSDSLVAFTKKEEGLSLVAYCDIGGVPTIGWGHTAGVKIGQHITETEAERLLTLDLDSACKAVNDLVGIQLTQGKLDCLTDFVFNCGACAFKTSHLRILVNEGKVVAVRKELLRWDHDGKRVVPGLLIRREKEAAMYE